MFILVNIIFTFVLGLLDKMLGWQRAGGEGILTTIYGILVFLPWWAVQFRRLHDTDRSAWWALLFLIPFIGWLIIIVFNCRAGTRAKTALDQIETGTRIIIKHLVKVLNRLFSAKKFGNFPQTP